MRRVDDKGFRDARWIPSTNLAQMNSSTVEHVINGSILSKRWLSRKASPSDTRQPIELELRY